MTTFDDREKTFEKKLALDEELAFKIGARRNKLLGLWLAEKLGKTGADAEAYAKEVVIADFDKPGDDDVIAKVLKDAQAGGLSLTEHDVRVQLQHFAEEAAKQIKGAA
jgi:hypothetical protein